MGKQQHKKKDFKEACMELLKVKLTPSETMATALDKYLGYMIYSVR